MGRFDGKVAFITGGARGQGRSHAVKFAEEGARVVLVDICEQIPSVEYPMATPADMAETEGLIKEAGGESLSVVADVRDEAQVQAAVDAALGRFGRIDFVVANAGIMATTGELAKQHAAWDDSLGTMLTGVMHTLRAATPSMVERGEGGSVVIISSTSGLSGVAYGTHMLTPGELAYGASKHGVIALMRNFALALGPHGIRVNAIHPMGVHTPMVINDFFGEVKRNAPAGWKRNVMNIGILEPRDVSNAVTWLCSDEARYITGTSVVIDAGQLL